MKVHVKICMLAHTEKICEMTAISVNQIYNKPVREEDSFQEIQGGFSPC